MNNESWDERIRREVEAEVAATLGWQWNFESMSFGKPEGPLLRYEGGDQTQLPEDFNWAVMTGALIFATGTRGKKSYASAIVTVDLRRTQMEEWRLVHVMIVSRFGTWRGAPGDMIKTNTR